MPETRIETPSLTYHGITRQGKDVYGACARTPVTELVERLYNDGFTLLTVKVGDDYEGDPVGGIGVQAGERTWWAEA